MSTLKVNTLQDTSGNGFYPARAWVKYNADGTQAIQDDKNVSSITDRGSAVQTINFSNSFSNAHYASSGVTANGGGGSESWQIENTRTGGAMFTGSLYVHTTRYSLGFDPTIVTAMMTGDM